MNKQCLSWVFRILDTPRQWLRQVQGAESRYYRAIGSAEVLMVTRLVRERPVARYNRNCSGYCRAWISWLRAGNVENGHLTAVQGRKFTNPFGILLREKPKGGGQALPNNACPGIFLFMTPSTATPPSTASGGFPSVAVPQRTVEYASGPLGRESHDLRHLAAFRDEFATNKGGWGFRANGRS